MTKPRVLLADDHRMFLAGLQKLLEPEFDIVGTADNGRQLLSAAEKLRPDVIVSDVSMPLLNGIAAAQRLAAIVPETKIVFLSMHADALFASEALRVGGAAYVLKRDAPAELIKAIHKALKDKRTRVLTSAAACSAPAANPTGSQRVLSLSSRQSEILQLTAEGKSLKEMSSILHISTKTVEFHKYRLMRATGARTNSDLIAIAIRHGFVRV